MAAMCDRGGAAGDRASLAEVATRARPELLVLHRKGEASEEQLARTIGGLYSGRFLVGHDLDVYEQ